MEMIKTERLVLSPLQQSDAEDCLRLFNSAGWLQYIGDRNVHTVEAAAEYLRTRGIACWKNNGFGSYHARLHDGTSVGNLGLYTRPELDLPDFGFALQEEMEGKGFAFEASQALLQHFDNTLDFEKLYAITMHTNMRSRSLLERLGFVESGTMKMGEEELMKFERRRP